MMFDICFLSCVYDLKYEWKNMYGKKRFKVFSVFAADHIDFL